MKAEGEKEKALKAAFYTGTAYILTVILLVLPYWLFDNYMLCLGLTLVMAVVIIFCFNFYLSVVKGVNFRQRFIEMTAISLGVATLSFFIGMALKIGFGIEV